MATYESSGPDNIGSVIVPANPAKKDTCYTIFLINTEEEIKFEFDDIG